MSVETASDGYGLPSLLFSLPDPVLPEGWRVLLRQHTEDGEHVWHLLDEKARPCRWLEDEGGLEWNYRQRVLIPQNPHISLSLKSGGV